MIGRFDGKTRGDLDGTKPVFMLVEPKSRPSRSQSTHSSEEAGQCRQSQGVQGGGDAMTKTTENQPVAVSAWRFAVSGASRSQPLVFVFDCAGRRLDFGVFRVIGR